MMDQVLDMLWDICKKVWTARNVILHSSKSFISVNVIKSAKDRLFWYHRHQHEVLDYRHRFLVDFTAEEVEKWLRSHREAKLEMLSNAQKYYDTECNQRAA